MSHANINVVASLVIPNGSNVSNAVTARGGHNGDMMVYGKTVTDGAITYIYQVSDAGTDWYDLVDSAAAAVIPPLENKAKVVEQVGVQLRIKSSANVTAARTWKVSAEI